MADAARITDVTASSEDRKHTSGVVFVLVDSNLPAVVGEKEGAVASIPGNEGGITKARVSVPGRMRVFFDFLLAFGRMDPKKRSPSGGRVEESQNHQASMTDGV